MTDEAALLAAKAQKKEKKDKKQKKEKKMKKKRKHEEVDAHDNVDDVDDKAKDNIAPKDASSTTTTTTTTTPNDADTSSSFTHKKKRGSSAERKKIKVELLARVPKVDEDGMAYTKLQIRRMMKRVKRGLPPIETPQEAHERMRNDAELRRQEEAELAGLYVRKNDKEKSVNNNDHDDDDDDDDGDNGDSEGEQDNGGGDDDDDEDDKGEKGDGSTTEKTNAATPGTSSVPNLSSSQPPTKKKARSKAVPTDYVCSACKNKCQPAHWIYDCPNKVTVRGANQKKKSERGLHDPDTRKVFVSGLPFEYKRQDVEKLFEEKLACGKVVQCKLVTFGDTGRCNGMAYVSLATDEAAKQALRQSGTVIDVAEVKDQKKKKNKANKEDEGTGRKKLKLKISRVENRRKTKKVQ